MSKLLNSAAAVLVVMPMTLGASSASAEGEVQLFHRSAADSARAPRMEMWQHCASELDITIVENFSPPEQYEVQLPVQLSSSTPPDIYALWAGGRAQFQAATGKIRNMNDVWAEVKDNFPEGIQATSTEPDGNVYVFPTTFQPNVFWYNKKLFAEHGISEPQTWDEMIAAADVLKAAGVTPFVLGAKSGWEPLFWFDYMILRVAGSDFRNGLMAGTESYLDPKVIQAMELWAELIEKEYFDDGYSSLGWREMATKLLNNEAAMEIMGPWTAGNFIRAGWEPDVDFGVFNFPTIDPNIPAAVEGAVEGWAASGAGPNTENAIAMLKCVTTADAQMKFAVTAQRPTANSEIPVDVYQPESIQPTMQKFYDMLDAPFHQNLELATHPGVTEIAKREFPRFLVFPDQYMDVLQRLEDRRIDIFEE